MKERVFAAPIAIAVLTMAGMLAGLLWGETGRYLSWPLVGSPVAVAAGVWLRVQLRRRRAANSPVQCRRG